MCGACLGIAPPQCSLNDWLMIWVFYSPLQTEARTTRLAVPSMANEEDDPVVQEVTTVTCALPRLLAAGPSPFPCPQSVP
jgi:hypothetical protein